MQLEGYKKCRIMLVSKIRLNVLRDEDAASFSLKMLRLPENVVGLDFKQHRLAALDGSLIAEYEKVVTDWMSTIEAILHDTSDERSVCSIASCTD